LCKVLDRVGNLRDIVFDEEFRTGVCAIVQLGCSDVAEVSDETTTKEIYETEDVVVFLGCVDRGETLMDKAVVVVFAYSRLSPMRP
jgi:hypothetical protein